MAIWDLPFSLSKASLTGDTDFHLPWNFHYFTSVMQLFCHNMHQHIRHFALSTYTIIVCSKHCFIQNPSLKVCEVFVKLGNHLSIVTKDIAFQSLSYEYLNGQLLWSSFSSME
jgi:hypothetical protein